MRPRDHGDLDNPETQRRLRERERTALEQARGDLRAVLELPAGRRFFWALLGRCAVFSSQLSGNALEAAQFEGRRAVGVALMVEAQEQHPQLYVTALREALERAQEDDLHRRAAEGAPHPEAEASTEDNDG